MKGLVTRPTGAGYAFIAGLMLWAWAAADALALDPSRTVFQYNCRTWSYQNGLPVNGINAITQTRDGYLWLGTSRGLVCFDGEEFRQVGMPTLPQARSMIINCLCPSGPRGLWFGLQNSSYGHFDGEQGWELLRRPDGAVEWNVQSLMETADQKLWIGGSWASTRAVTNAELRLIFTNEVQRPHVVSLLADSRGRTWLGTTERGLFVVTNGLPVSLPNLFSEPRIISALAEDRAGNIWIGTHIGLYWLDAQWQLHEAPFPGFAVSALLVDQSGQLWVGTTTEGLARREGENFTWLNKVSGLAGDHVLSLAEDHEGNVWVGTRDGLTQLSDVKLPMFTAADGMVGRTVQSVNASPRGGLWVCTDQGLNYFSDRHFTLFSKEAGLGERYVKRVLETAKGEVYVVSGKNLIEIMVDGRVVAAHPTRAMPVALTEDTVGVVVSIGGELFRVSREKLEPYAFVNDTKPPLYWVYNLTTSRDGAIWVACVNGICRVKDGQFQQWTVAEGLGDYHCRWLMEDETGVMWGGMATGLSRLKDGKIFNFRREDGLLDGNIHAVLADELGYLWVDSGSGLYRVSQQALNDYAAGGTNQIVSIPFNGPEAVKVSEHFGQEHSAAKTPDGRLWFPTVCGMAMIEPQKIRTNLVVTPVHLQSVRANGKELNLTQAAVIPPGEGSLEFNYRGLNYASPQKVQYRYQLSGYDKNWVNAGARRNANYANLKPGQYEFLVEACNADGVWNDVSACFTVKLQPHYYQTAWFKVLLGGCSVVLVFLLYAGRMRHLRRKQQQLQESRDLLEVKVQERTAELAATNHSLHNEIEERKRAEAEVERIHRQLVDASRQAGQAEVASSVLHNVGNVLNSVNVSTTVLTDRLRGLRLDNLSKAVQLLRENQPDLGRFLSEDAKGRKLPDYFEKLGLHLTEERSKLLTEVGDLAGNIEHIKTIVAMQQNYARVAGVEETVALADLVESAIRMHAAAYVRHGVTLMRDFAITPEVTLDKHKVLQILVNILHNAKYACDQSGRTDKQVIVSIRTVAAERVSIEVADNGVGIGPEHLPRIFTHGFTTKTNGHGFGLHSAAIAAQQLGGSLVVHSAGLGLGATFTLEIPLCKPHSAATDSNQLSAVLQMG
ncbi:MAG: two-component regulator propeller domain-containing protein [Verrucomicrobiota bacterium]